MTSPDHVSNAAANGGAAGHEKYRPYAGLDLPDRTWPGMRIETAPVWCSVAPVSYTHLTLPTTPYV